MDKYEQKIAQLSQRIRRLEIESLQTVMPDKEIRNMIEDLDLVPMPFRSADNPPKLTGEVMMDIIEDLGYSCRWGEDFVNVETGEGRIQVNFDSLPMVSITNGYLFDETPESVTSMRKAAFEVTGYWDMVKVLVDPTEGHLLIYLNARHEDVVSFSSNIKFYIDQVLGASKDLKERYRDLERNRILECFRTIPKQTLS